MKGVTELFKTTKSKKKEGKSVSSNLPVCSVEPGISCVHFGNNLCSETESCGIVREYRKDPKEHKAVDYKLHDEDA